MRKPWFGPFSVFAVFPITWQGWVAAIGVNVLIVCIAVFVPEFFSDPEKGRMEANGFRLIAEAIYFVFIVWNVGVGRGRSRRRAD